MDPFQGWFDEATVAVHRASSTVTSNQSSITETEIYPKLKVALEGLSSESEQTILGDFGIARYRMHVRESDIDVNGWPAVEDRVVLNGHSYTISTEEDHTNVPAAFTLIKKHKAYILSQEVNI